MYAIFEDGAHQYKVEAGDRVDVHLHDINDDQNSVEFDKVLYLRDGDNIQIGQPYVSGAKITATIEGEVKGDKVTIVKYRRRKNYRLKKGHRQAYLRLKIDKIEA